ncbi:O-antigen ligase family protein [bacterium]|nr:O-antigen ligase family protein [candidate division CSSED10-310 bacterium]
MHPGKSRDSLPGLIVVGSIFILSCAWAGYRPSGYALLHVLILTALILQIVPGSTRPKECTVPPPLRYASTALLIYILLNGLILSHSAKGIDTLILWLDLFTVGWILLQTPPSARMIQVNCWLGFSLILTAAHGSFLIFSSGQDAVPGFFRHGFHFGFYAVLVLFPALGVFLRYQKRNMGLLGLATAACAFLYLLMDVKSSPLIGLAVGIAVYFSLFLTRKKAGHFAWLLLFLLVLLITAVLFFPDRTFQDLQRHIELKQLMSAHWAPMKTALTAAGAHPVRGIGLGNFEYLSGQFKPEKISNLIVRAHNSPFQWAAETGLAGVVLLFIWLGVLSKGLLNSLRSRESNGDIVVGAAGALAAVIPLSFLDFGLQMPANTLATVFVLSIALADGRNRTGHGSVPVLRRVRWLLVILLLPAVTNLTAAVLSDAARHRFDHGRFRQGIRLWKTASRFRPMDDRIHADIASACLRMAQYNPDPEILSACRQAIDRSLDLNPVQAPMHYAKAVLLNLQRKQDSAIERMTALDAAIRLDPNNVGYIMARMEILSEMANLPSVVREYAGIVRVVSDADVKPLTLHLIELMEHHGGLTREMLEILSDLPPRTALMMTAILRQSGKPDQAELLLSMSFHSMSGDFRSEDWMNYARQADGLKTNRLCRDICRSGLQRVSEPEHQSILWVFLGDVEWRIGKKQDALAAYSRAAATDPENMSAHMKTAHCIGTLKDSHAAVTYLTGLTERFPRNMEIRRMLAAEYERSGQIRKAIQQYEHVLLFGNQPGIRAKLDELYGRVKSGYR